MTLVRQLVAAATLAASALAAPALAANLTIGLATDVTAIDPHYHNLTPNNNVASHLFGYLVERNEKSQLIPGLATEWKAIDPTTWEFKLRQAASSSTTAASSRPPTSSRRSSACRRCRTARRRSPRTRSRSRRSRWSIPYTIRFKTARRRIR